jgi:paraquat-inducible protein B
VHIDASILSGIEVDSESIETLLAGGIAFATPESPDGLINVDNGHRFALKQEFQEEWHDWQPVILIDNK